MSDSIYLHLFLRELKALRREARRARSGQRLRDTELEQRLERLEGGLGRVALLARALAELGLERGWLTTEDLGRMLKHVDAADGAEDEQLDPRVALPGETRLAELEPIVPPEPPQPRRRTRKGRR